MTPLSLSELADRHLAAAETASSGRSAATVFGGSDHVLSQTMIALTAGTALAEHENPARRPVQVPRGRVRLTAGDDSIEGGAGDLLVVPPFRYALAAAAASVVLLTVGKYSRRGQGSRADHEPTFSRPCPDGVAAARASGRMLRSSCQ